MNKKPIIIGVGVLGLAALGYYAYMRSQTTVYNPQALLPGAPAAKPGQIQQASGYPDKASLLRIAQASGWPGDIFNALNATYNQATGTGNHGDWKIQVISINPITLQFRKGATEQFKLTEGKATGFKGLGNINSLAI